MAGKLQGKRAIVTGAGSGIGRASARLFAEQGAKLLIADWNEESLAATQQLIEADGGHALTMKADTGNEADVKALVGRALAELSGLEVFFANAGISGNAWTLEDTSFEEFQNVLRVNLLGPFLAIKYASPHMAQQKAGSIICTASVAGIRSGAGPIAYSASKAGVINLVQTTANGLRGSGVRVNAICPGLIETGMTQPLFDVARARGKEDRIGQLNPLLRAGQPEEIASAALFLASDDASYVNGQALVVDGGLTSSLPVVLPRS